MSVAFTNSRILLVGADAELSETIERSLDAASVTRVDDYFLALGHLGTQAATEVPSVIIGRMNGLDESPEAAAQALRKLAPDSRLVLISQPGNESFAKRAMNAGFDQYLVEPLDPAALRRALSSPPPLAASQSSSQHSLLLTPDELLGQPSIIPYRADHLFPNNLGDIDLIERLLCAREPIRPLAMQLLSSHSGISQVSWAEPRQDVPASNATVEVALGQNIYGLLHAPPPANVETLRSWAGWLARWLALEQRFSQFWNLAIRDELTDLFNRRYLHRFLDHVLKRAVQERFRVTVLVFDIDDFKIYNDRYGHGAGDEILRESARLMVSAVREHDVVARIGGDEFAVVFWDAEGPRRRHSEHPDSIRKAASRFQRAICRQKFPKLAVEAPGTLTISGGIAGFPWDGRTPDELLQRADEMALQSKHQGKNVITFGPGSQETCEVLFPDTQTPDSNT